ncbi:MAG: DUF2207 domain-containing protein [bacterium]
MKIQKKIILLTLISLYSLFCPVKSLANIQQEKIIDFNSVIYVFQDSHIKVIETIQVVCAQKKIKRGITREFPTRYKDRFGNTVDVGFEIEEILKNGSPEPYHTQKLSNGQRIFIGSKDVFLKPGVYTYTITYNTTRQLGFFEDYDELYWNVTGDDWAFLIEKASAKVILPRGAEVLKKTAYTGPKGAQDRNFEISSITLDTITFTTTKYLEPGEGLTIAVSWPKGIVSEPGPGQKIAFVFQDNRTVFIALVGLIICLFYYLIVWVKVGKDPEKETIIPLFTPPESFTPADVRYLMRMGYDDKTFASAIVGMAVKGFLKITEDEDKTFTLKKTGAGDSLLSSREKKIASELLGTGNEIVLKQYNHTTIQKAIKTLRKGLQRDLEKIYFLQNSSYFVPGIILSLFTLALAVRTASDKSQAGFMLLWLSFWSIGCSALFINTKNLWKKVMAGTKESMGKALGGTFFFLPFFGGEILGIVFLAHSLTPLAVIFILGIVFLNILFYQLLKAPTIRGRKVMDQIEGFKLYLSVAEKERLDMMNPPDKTPALFEKYLPYALALDVENQWSEQFSDVLAKAGEGKDGYSPAWYSGGSWERMGYSGLASNLGSSFSDAVSSSSTAPGSSSGSGGGGSSGGGGGGGGGGGW